MFNEPTIKSKDNAKLKFARRVRDGKEYEHIFIEGVRLCDEALGSSLSITTCFLSEPFRESGHLARLGSTLDSKNIESFVVSESLLASISETKTPQGIVLIADRPTPVKLGELFSGDLTNSPLPVWIYLYEVSNPSNLGAVIRTAEAAGAKGIIVSTNSANPFSPRSLRASMGSAFRLPVVNGAAVEDVLSKAKAKGIGIVAIDTGGPQSYADVNWKMPRLLIFGSEADGLPEGIISLAGEKLKIPMHGKVESLNLAVSGGIILFEAKRQNEI
jgi:TrmH family RNA methyltransferase